MIAFILWFPQAGYRRWNRIASEQLWATAKERSGGFTHANTEQEEETRGQRSSFGVLEALDFVYIRKEDILREVTTCYNIHFCAKQVERVRYICRHVFFWARPVKLERCSPDGIWNTWLHINVTISSATVELMRADHSHKPDSNIRGRFTERERRGTNTIRERRRPRGWASWIAYPSSFEVEPSRIVSQHFETVLVDGFGFTSLPLQYGGSSKRERENGRWRGRWNPTPSLSATAAFREAFVFLPPSNIK